MLEARGRRRAPPHARPFGVDRCQGAPQWPEGRHCAVRGDLPLRWTSPPENEVHEVPSQTYEHEALSRTHSLPCSLKNLLAYRSRVRILNQSLSLSLSLFKFPLFQFPLFLL